jgi:hypothetical protein
MKNLLPTVLTFIQINKIKITIIALSLISAGAIATSIWAIWFREAPTLNPDYAAKETEKDAEKIEGSENDGGGELVEGGKINIIYSPEVTVDLSDGKASLLIGNLAKSKHNIVAELVIQDNIIFQTGAVQPGYRVVNTDIASGAADMLSEGVYNGVLRLYMYDVQTNEREMLSTDIVVQINVKE